MDSDSDDIHTNNVFTFQTMNTTVCAKGPNMTNITNFNMHNRIPASSIHMPQNMQHSRYATSVYDQRSIYSRREVSPMSVRSTYDFQPRNFNMSHYPRGMSSQRSVINGRSASPSMSMASTTSVSAFDIAMAFKNAQFNKHEFKLISDAYKKFVKCKIRKKFEKRRNHRLFLKGARRRSGGESGEQGSDSSISDDDCKSTRNSMIKGNVSSCLSTRTDLTNIRKTMQESNIYNDCSANLKQKSFKNMFTIDSGSLNPNICKKPQNAPLQKDRFRSGFLLPSQRFNKSIATTTIQEKVEKQHRNMYEKSIKENFCVKDKMSKTTTTDSEHDEIFEDNFATQNQLDTEPQRKRCLEKDDETHMPNKKKNKLSPIKKIPNDILNDNHNIDPSDKNKDDFIFAKPSFPIKKICDLRTKEKIIAKSPNINDIFERNHSQEHNHVSTAQQSMLVHEKEPNQSKELSETSKHTNIDVSMRPSFIKRKLFTQKLDVAENKILSSDTENSPKTVYGGIQKEKNKARKLVTNQSCLSRDVLQDDNYLDLIHKIVPPDLMNSTNQPNKSDIQSKSKDLDDKWGVTSEISTCNKDNVSDTYTDEDIFQDNNNTNINKGKKSKNETAVIKNRQNCKELVERVPPSKNIHHKSDNTNQRVPASATNLNTNSMKTCAKTFWDTDLESDLECCVTLERMNIPPKHQGYNIKAADQQPKKQQSMQTRVMAPDVSLLNNTTASLHKFNNTSICIKSHRVSKKKKCEEIDKSNSTLNLTQNKNPKSKDMSCLSYTAFVNNVKTSNAPMTGLENNSNNGRTKRSCRTPKQNPKETIINEIKKRNHKKETNQALRSRKADLSSTTLDDKGTVVSKPKKQNATNNKQSKPCNNKQQEKTKPIVNTRKSNVSFSLDLNIKAAKPKKVAIKHPEYVNNSRERKSRQSNISFSITSDFPLTRSKVANKNNVSFSTVESPLTRSKTVTKSIEKQKDSRNNTKINNNEYKNIPVKQIIKTPNKKVKKNGVLSMVQDLKTNKSKSVRKR